MHSIRTKIMTLTVFAIVLSMTVATVMAAIAIKDYGESASNQILYLLCESGQRSLNAYFESIEQSVQTVSVYASNDLQSSTSDDLTQHIEHVRDIFENMAEHTAGVSTYYYRIDPLFSTQEKGFWFVHTEKDGFVEHKVTDISLYDSQDQSALMWFTIPKATGEAIWLPPYVTENLGAYVLSYNVPIYRDDQFVGVAGIEIDYQTIAFPVENITLYENGYAFISDADGSIICHPRIPMEALTGEDKFFTPKELLGKETYKRYTYNGVKKLAVWMPLGNGMRLYVTVPVSEINSRRDNLIVWIIAISIILLLVFALITARLTRRLTNPLRKLTEAAEQVNVGNYDVMLDYNGSDEVGILTRTFNRLVNHLKIYISDLNDLAYADALTNVHNKGAFDIFLHKLQTRASDEAQPPAFAACFFDCDDLKVINDRYGRDKGDLYLKAACALICQVFQHSPVFRTGGDEFAVILQNDDFQNRTDRIALFAQMSDEVNAAAQEPWEQVHVSMGMAVYEPQTDLSVEDVVRRADQMMYQNKRKNKIGR